MLARIMGSQPRHALRTGYLRMAKKKQTKNKGGRPRKVQDGVKTCLILSEDTRDGLEEEATDAETDWTDIARKVLDRHVARRRARAG
jgi:hypothetical protein